ncbi:MAG: patatin-like phospholipase family protein [Patescibacteria group bacterium]
MDLGRIGIIVTGGGCKCAFQVGCFQALDEYGIRAEKIQGISGGCLNAAKYLESGSNALKQVWIAIEKSGYSSLFSRWDAIKHIAFANSAIFRDDGLNALVNQLNMENILHSPVNFEVVVWNEVAERNEIFSNQNLKNQAFAAENLKRLIKASASLPGFFSPEDINGNLYSDGCEFILNTFAEMDTVFIIDPSQPQPLTNKEDLKNLYKNLRWDKRIMKRFSSLIDRCMEKEMKYFCEVNKFKVFPEDTEAQWPIFNHLKEFLSSLAGIQTKRLIAISPSINIPTLMLDFFQKGDISRAVSHGYESSKEILEKLKS